MGKTSKSKFFSFNAKIIQCIINASKELTVANFQNNCLNSLYIIPINITFLICTKLIFQ